MCLKVSQAIVDSAYFKKLGTKASGEVRGQELDYLALRTTSQGARNDIIVPRFSSQCLKNSINNRGAILWNAVSTHFTGQFSEGLALILRNLI